MNFKFLILLTLAGATVANAYPNVGDEAYYEGCRPTENGCIHFTKEHQIVSHNATAKTYDVNVRLWEQGSGPQYRTITVEEKYMISTNDIQKVFSRCSGTDGKTTYEKLDIKVPAGKFPVCKVYSSETGDTIYIGNVPFGVLKAEGPTINAELISYKDGSSSR